MYQLIFGAKENNLEIWAGIICLGYLCILSLQDILSCTVSMKLLLIGIIISIIYQIVWGSESLFLCAAGAVVGFAFIGISKVTQEGIGYGDSILIFVLGIYLGLWELLYLLLSSFVLSAIFSIIILTRCHYHRKKSFPFIPFLTAGYLFLFLWKIY